MHTVLYIEDNPENMRLVTRIMKHRPNIKLLTAISGQEGLDISQLEKPHLILLDINLPLMDGYELLKKLRQNETTRQIPVIAVSANAMNSDIERGLSAGFAEYITKPINVRKLLDAIDLAVDHKQGAA
jgi:CheY-like chemotaxis protein